MEILRGNFLMDTKEETVMANEILREAEYVGLYFSASWCPPCQTFLPRLRRMYEAAQSRRLKLEIVYVPSDSDQLQMARLFMKNHGPWYAVPVGPMAVEIRRKMQVFTIPAFVILDKKGKVLTKKGRDDIESYEDPLPIWFPEA